MPVERQENAEPGPVDDHDDYALGLTEQEFIDDEIAEERLFDALLEGPIDVPTITLCCPACGAAPFRCGCAAGEDPEGL